MGGNTLARNHRHSFLIILWMGAISALCAVVIQCASTPTTSQGKDQVVTIPEGFWPHQISDLAPDPDAVFGRLPNGLRYVLLQNQTPLDRVSMHLFIQAGSLLETKNERGIAHFLEHMQFNGSTHFAPGEVVKYFQRIGMQFGPDANAHTGFDQTVYDILLPRGDGRSIDEALVVLKDYAQGALLLPEEVDKERKVVLAEMRTRDSSRFRTLKETLKFEMPELLISRRLPIGEKAVIEKVDAQTLRGFYDAWYRPEQMILVIVGDFTVSEVQRSIKKDFSDLKARAPLREPPPLGRMRQKGDRYFFHQEANAGATTIAIEAMVQDAPPEDSSQSQEKELMKNLAIHMMQKRLDAILQQPDSALTSAGIGAGYFLRQIHYAEIRGECKPGHWQQALTLLEQTLRKALQYGFTPSELLVAKGDFKAQLLRKANASNTRESKTMAREIMASISRWKVYQSPGQRLARMGPMIEAASLEQVNQSFVDIWQGLDRLVMVTGNADLKSDKATPAVQIETAYLASQQQALSPPVNKKLAVFPYLEEPAAGGTILRREHLADLGIEKVTFANGFTLLFKKTNFKANQVLAALSFGQGTLSEPLAQPGLAQWTEAVINESGFGQLDRIALEEALAGHWADIELNVREDAFIIKGESVSSDLLLLLQLIYTAVQDPGYHPDAFHKVYRQFEQKGQRLPHSVDGVMELHGQRFLSGNDSRFGTPEWQQLRQGNLDQIKKWYGEQLHRTPMELAVVGDFQPEALVKWVARYFGALSKRDNTLQQPTRPGPTFPEGKALRLEAETNIPKALVVVAYPTEDFWDIHRTRRLAMTAELFSERLRQHVREELGAAYSPFAYNHSYRGYRGYGLLQIHVQVDPGQADVIATEVKRIADQLAASSSDDDEIRRILDPTLTRIKDLRQKNAYWLNSVLKGAARHPEQLAWARTFEKDYAAITAEDIRALSLKYLDNQKGATIVITPKGDAP